MKKYIYSVLGIFLLSTQSLYANDVFQEGAPSIKGGVVTVPSFAELAKIVGPAVVQVSSEPEEPEEESEESVPGLPFKFKGQGNSTSLGSGFIINKEGYIITNNHVIDKGEKVIVKLVDDPNEYQAELVGKDDKTDLALIKINVEKELTALYLGDSDQLQVGDWVIAIGHQFQLGQTVTSGIVSAKSRRVPRGGPYDNFIQTDASINPGSSGGPLLNTKGQVVGINTAIFSPGKNQYGGTGFNIGIGFAVPINLAKRIVNQLRETGGVTRGWLGVIIQKVTPDIKYVFGLKKAIGALVSHVMEGSPAEEAKFERGDIIVGFDGKLVRDNEDLPLMVANTNVGKKVDVEVIRDSKKIILPVVIKKLDDGLLQKEPETDQMTFDNTGLSMKDLTEDLLAVLKLPKMTGALVNDVKPGSAAAKAGVIRGDILQGIRMHGQKLKNISKVSEYVDIMEKADVNKPILLLVRRIDSRTTENSTTLYLTLKLH